MAKEKDSIGDELIKIGLVLGAIWLGSKILEDLSKKKNGGSNYEERT